MSNIFLNLVLSLQTELSSVVSRMGSFNCCFVKVWNWISSRLPMLAWEIYKVLLGIMEMLEYLATSFLGIGTTVDDYYSFANKNNLMSTYTRTFRAVCGVAIVLMIIFTIIAIIRQEYANAVNPQGINAKNNPKGPFIMRLFKSTMAIIVLPLAVLIIIGGINSVLTSFRNALRGSDTRMTMAQTMLYGASYDSNKSRNYAYEAKRIPAIITTYQEEDFAADEQSEFASYVKSTAVQDSLKNTYNMYSDSNLCPDFDETLRYENNKLINDGGFSGNYETFICTPEQYQVLAEFSDYSQRSQAKYCIRPMDDKQIDWKYVDQAVYNKEDGSLTINYRDLNDLNKNGETTDTYTITYSMSYEVTSPISNAVKTLEALLGVGEYQDNLYYEMERDKDSVNMVQWANEKVSIHFSKDFQLNMPEKWTSTDSIIMYEYYHYATNNTFSAYSLDDFSYDKAINENDPVTLDAYKYVYRVYYEEANAYSPETQVDCVLINGNYYTVEKSDEEMDEYGDYYYVLKELEDVDFLSQKYTTIYENTSNTSRSNYNVLIKFTGVPSVNDGKFDLNNMSTWSYTDQIIIYEYYKDLTYRNSWSKYTISDFYKGIEFPTYTIAEHKDLADVSGAGSAVTNSPKSYVLINDVYYQVKQRSGVPASDKPYYELCAPEGETKLFDKINDSSIAFFKYEVALSKESAASYGISTVASTGKTADNFIISITDTNHGDESYYLGDGSNTANKKTIYDAFVEDLENDDYSSFDLKFSRTFDYKDTGTWNYKDYFLMYLYSKYLIYSKTVTLDQLRISNGLPGKIGRVGTSVSSSEVTNYMYLYKIDESVTVDYNDDPNVQRIIYLKIDDILDISEKNISTDFDLDRTLNANDFDLTSSETLRITTDNLSVSYSLAHTETETYEIRFSDSVTGVSGEGGGFYNVKNWKIKDYILFTLSESGYINIKSSVGEYFTTAKFSSYSYNTTVYKIPITTSNYEYYNADDIARGYIRFFCFGSGDNKIYLNENYITRKTNGLGFESFDEFLNTNLMTFVKNQNGNENIISDIDTISSDLYDLNDLSSYVYNKNDIIKEIVKNYIYNIDKNSGLYLYNQVSTFSYYNANFDATDLSTWTNLDFVLYYVNGKVLKKNYYFSIIQDNSNNKYCKINDKYAVSIDNSSSLLYIDETNSKLIEEYNIYSELDADLPKATTTTENVKNYFIDNHLEDNLLRLDASETVISSTGKYKYNFNQDADYYSVLDTYLIGLSEATYKLSESKYKSGNVYSLDIYSRKGFSEQYIKLGEKGSEVWLYKIEAKDLTPVYTETKTTIEYPAGVVFSCEGSNPEDKEYTPFENIANSGADKKFKLVDALIYYHTGFYQKVTGAQSASGNRVPQKEKYTIYKCKINEVRYIVITDKNGETKFIEYSDYTRQDIGYAALNTIDDKVKAYQSLYTEKYKTLVTNPKQMSGLYANYIAVNMSVTFDIDNISTWTPLNVILYFNGIIDSSSSAQTIGGGSSDVELTLHCSETGKKHYLVVRRELDESVIEKYIDITNLINIKSKHQSGKILDEDDLITAINNEAGLQDDIKFDHQNEASNGLLFTLSLLRLNETSEKTADYYSNIISSTNTNINAIKNKINNYNLSNQQVTIAVDNTTLNLSDLSTYTWYDLLCYYLFGETNSNIYFTKYYSNNKSYINIMTDKNYFINFGDKFNSWYNQKIQRLTSVNVSFNLSGTIDKKAVIYSKMTSKSSGTLDQYNVPLLSSKFYSFVSPNGNSDSLTYIYGINTNDNITTNSTSDVFTYTSNAVVDNINDWSILDFALNCIMGDVLQYPKTYTGNLVKINSMDYFHLVKTGEYDFYINLHALNFSTVTTTGSTYTAGTNVIYNINSSDETLVRHEIVCGKKLSSFFGEFNATGTFSYSYTNELQKKVYFKFTSANVPELSKLSDQFVKLKFSKNYDKDDEKTWQLSDYILKYIFDKSKNNGKKNYDTRIANSFEYYIKLGYVPATIYDIMENDGTIVKAYLIGSSDEITITNENRNNYLFVVIDDYHSFADMEYNSVKINNQNGEFLYGIHDNDGKFVNSFEPGSRNSNAKVNMNVETNLKFSDGFDYSDVSTWKLSDYLIYYIYRYSLENNGYLNFRTNFDYYTQYGVPVSLYNISDPYVNSGATIQYVLVGTSKDVVINETTINDYLFIKKSDYDTLATKNFIIDNVDDVLNSMYVTFGDHNITVTREGSTTYNFGSTYKFNNTSTWNLKDFLMYDVFKKSVLGYDDKLNYAKTINTNFQYYIEQGYVPAMIYYLNEDGQNSYGNNVQNKVLVIGADQDVVFTNENKNDYYLVNYNLFYGLYQKLLYNIKLNNVSSDTLVLDRLGQSIDESSQQAANLFGIKFDLKTNSCDFVYDNYYYFIDNNNFFSKHSDVLVSSTVVEAIANSNTSTISDKYVNLRLSDDFDLNNIDTWTILDYIIIYEYSRNVKNNVFNDMTFIDISTSNNLTPLHMKDNRYVLIINGNYYDLTDINSSLSDSPEVTVTKKVNKQYFYNTDGSFNHEETVEVVKKANILSDYNYSFKVLKESTKIDLTMGRYQIIKKLTNNAKNLVNEAKVNVAGTQESPSILKSKRIDTSLYSGVIDLTNIDVESEGLAEGVSIFRSQVKLKYYRDLAETFNYYQISLTRYENYKISTIVKQVNWPRKLMNDMKVIYPDLNWSNLIATDSWIDTLGDYRSGTTSGQYVESGNSANITAVGMVLSEFFLSVANKSESHYANFEYESIFDQSTINALMLAMLGEYEYNSLVTEAKVFVDLFNTAFASILDDVAYERGIKIKEGDTSNLVMTIYKSYLATAILSSDLGEYLYTIATRVYAQYTIFESFARAKGDYANYYAYINGLTGEDGEVVDKFLYADFRELTQYENKYLNDGDIPIFTFNAKSVLKALYPKDYEVAQNSNVLDSEVSKILANEYSDVFRVNFNGLITDYMNYYKNVYINGRMSEEPRISSNDKAYCYLFDVYWSIYQTLALRGMKERSFPVYLDYYKKYLTGSISRWSMFGEVSINAGSSYLPDNWKYKLALFTKKLQVTANVINCFGVEYNRDESLDDLSEEEREQLKAELESAMDPDNYLCGVSVLHRVFARNTVCDQIISNYLPYNITYIFELLLKLSASEGGSVSAWNYFKNMKTDLDIVCNELSKVLSMDVNEFTDMGSCRYSDLNQTVVSNVYNKVKALSTSLSEYISVQQILDTIGKTSITFTLAQFSNNYVEDGYQFTLNNKQYKMKTSASVQRLAEYVYGGSFLVDYGIQPTFTSSTFEGIIDVTTVFDERTGLVKKKLDIFTKLREFARKIADYTGKLYYLTNLNDVSERTNDSTYLDEYFYAELPNLYLSNDVLDKLSSDSAVKTAFSNSTILPSGKYYKTTLESLMIDYIIKNEYLSYDTLYSLLVIDTVNNDVSSTFYNKIKGDPLLLMLYNNNFSSVKMQVGGSERTITINSEVESKLKTLALRRYLMYIQSTATELSESASVSLIDINKDYGYYNSNGYIGNYCLDTNNSSERVHLIFEKVMLYIIGIETNLTHIHFKDLKVDLMNALVDYIQYDNSTGEENSLRYLTILYLVTGEFDYFSSKSSYYNKASSVSETQLGRVITLANKDIIAKSRTSETPLSLNNNSVSSSSINTLTGEVGYKSFGEIYYLRAKFRTDSQSKGMILKLAGIANRPVEELVNLEYNELYDRNGCYDERDGDTFIMCTYDTVTGKYYPILAKNKEYVFKDNDPLNEVIALMENYNNTKNKPSDADNLGKALNIILFDSENYDTQYAYPVVARGIIVADGLPTAIRMENGEVIYYRDSVTISGSLNEGAMQNAVITSEVTTVGYTRYVPMSTFSQASDRGNQSMMYSGANSQSSQIKSDASAYYVKYTIEYKVEQTDEDGQSQIYDNFEEYYYTSPQKARMFLLLMFLQSIVVTPIMFKVLVASMRRILDIMFLVLAGPLMISMNSLEYKLNGEGKFGNSKAFDEWKRKLTASLLSAFGLILSFHLYGLIIGTALDMTYVTAGDSTMQIVEQSGVLKFIILLATGLLNSTGYVQISGVVHFMNFIVKFFFIIVGANMIETAAKMIGKLVTSGKVENPFNSQVDNKDTTKELIKMTKTGVVAVTQLYSGEMLENLMHHTLEKFKELIPGSAVFSKFHQIHKNHNAKKDANEMAKRAVDAGADQNKAKELSKQIYEEKLKQMEAKRKNHEKKAKAFESTMKVLGGEADPSQFLEKRRQDRENFNKKSDAAFKERNKKKKKKKEKKPEKPKEEKPKEEKPKEKK